MNKKKPAIITNNQLLQRFSTEYKNLKVCGEIWENQAEEHKGFLERA